MPKRALLLISLLIFILSFSALALADNWHKEFQLTGMPELNLRVDDTHVRIEPWDKNYVSVDVTTENMKLGQSPGELEIHDYQRDNFVEITMKERGVHFSIGWSRSRRSETMIRMPAKAKLDIQTSDGSLMVSRMNGEFRLRTSDGRLTAEDLDGILDASTSDGRLTVSGKFSALNTHTSDGRMEVTVAPGSAMMRSWSMRTGDGGIRLRLPKDFNADLDVHTGDGHLDVEMPVTVSGRIGGHEMRGKLGSGGELLTVRSGDGSVVISST